MNVLRAFIYLVSLAVVVPSVFAQEQSKGGTLACGGNHDFRRGNSEITLTSYTFRNFNTDNTITVDSIKVFTADGVLVKNIPAVDPFPAGFSNVLGPNQTSNFNTNDLFGTSPATAPQPTPLQTIVTWSATAKGTGLVVSVARQDRGRDTISGNLLEQRARGLSRCTVLK